MDTALKMRRLPADRLPSREWGTGAQPLRQRLCLLGHTVGAVVVCAASQRLVAEGTAAPAGAPSDALLTPAALDDGERELSNSRGFGTPWLRMHIVRPAAGMARGDSEAHHPGRPLRTAGPTRPRTDPAWGMNGATPGLAGPGFAGNHDPAADRRPDPAPPDPRSGRPDLGTPLGHLSHRVLRPTYLVPFRAQGRRARGVA